jgi:diguanylate cyclase (GGDEF)-like protein
MNLIALAAAFAAVAAAVALVAALLLARRRSPGSTDERLVDAVDRINERLEAMARELGNALERAQEETRRSRVLGELGGSIDFDEVLGRTLEAAAAAAGVDAAVVAIEAGAGEAPHVLALGLDVAPGTSAGAARPPDGRLPRSIRVSYAYDQEQEAAGAAPLRDALSVPLLNEGEHLGYLTVYGRRGDGFTAAHASELEELALRAGPAIENARRFREAKQLADLDALTGLHNRRFFHDTLAREVARAHRYDRNLALIVLDLDDFKAVNDRIGHLAGDAVLAEAAERVRDVVRSADIACRVGGDEFAVILPESGIAEAQQLFARLQTAVSAGPVGPTAAIHLSAGLTELRADDDAPTLFQRADEALYRAKGAGKRQVVTVPAGGGAGAAGAAALGPR